LRQQQELKDREQFTFKPQITARAQVRERRIEEDLISYGKMVSDKRSKIAKDYESVETHYDFRPKINKTS